MRIERYKGGRWWAVYDAAGVLVCVTVYKRGAREVLRRLGQQSTQSRASEPPNEQGQV